MIQPLTAFGHEPVHRVGVAISSPSASAEGKTVYGAWKRFADERRQTAKPLIGNPARPSENLVTQAAQDLRARLDCVQSAQAVRLLEQFASIASASDIRGECPPLRVLDSPDGAVLVEWTFRDRRLGFTFEPRPEESGWYFVFSAGSSQRYESGTLDQLDLRRLMRAMLSK